MRSDEIAKLIRSYLEPGNQILDIGAGSCLIDDVLVKKYGFDITPIDVVYYNKTSLELVIYDGKHLPFKDNTFDVSLLIFVLHHEKDQKNLLKEAIRVAKKRIIIVEDTPQNWFEYILWLFWDHLLNFFHSTAFSKAHRVVRWFSIFEKYNLKVTYFKNFRTFFPVLKTYQHTIFVLDKV
ncbi:MAG: class I SAM-dependent methyltransferase [Patescibacteria group bacterium]